MGRRPPLSSTERSMKFPTFRRVRRKRKANVFLIMIGQAMDFHFIASISMPAIHDKTTAKVTKRNETSKKIINFLANPKNFHRKKDTKESLLSHQIFRNQISEHHLRKVRYSHPLNRSIFGLVLSDDKLTVSPIYTCIQMEVAFVGLFYANICTTFAIYLKRRRRTVVFILQPP